MNRLTGNSRSYKKSMSLAREKSGTRRSKALMLAAAAALELDREQKAKVLYKKALQENPDLDMPDVVRSKRALRFFADVREGREPDRTLVKVEETPAAFDSFTTYLPFGLNQLVQEKFLLGLTFGSLQAFGIHNAYVRALDAERSDLKLAAARRTAIQTGDDINPVFQDFAKKTQNFGKKARQESQLSILLAVAGYGASVLEAGYNPPARGRVGMVAMQNERSQFSLGLQFAMKF